jgi:hypothetical protein
MMSPSKNRFWSGGGVKGPDLEGNIVDLGLVSKFCSRTVVSFSPSPCHNSGRVT